ncbi:serine hydrolase domain-containing protein [Leucobacter edaphi]|uniref:serine hydrolase domain-containing protein n=1 Tax=Leucobacter edaphi TaxID=2796472 RepID=UPI0034E1ED7B
MRLLRRSLAILAGLLTVALVAAVGAYWWQRPMILTGTGYAAHNACAVSHVAGRENPESDLPPNPLVPYLDAEVTERGATASLLGVLATQRAVATDGAGCTLTDGRPDVADATPIDGTKNPLTTAPAPPSEPAIDAALAKAFGDDLPDAERTALGTRAVVALKNGKLVGERYAEGFDARTPQLGWSMSKSAASLLTGIMVQRGEVRLSDSELRPEWTDDRSQITIEELLRMTSGLQWDETYDLGTPITRMLYLEPDMASYVASLPLAHEPGTAQQYSSGSTTLLCSVLAERSGLGSDVMNQRLLAPLGLSSAVMEPDGAGTPVCSSYLWMTPRDWAALGQFALQDGVWNGDRLLPADWMRKSLDVHATESTDDPGFGMSWRVNVLPDGSIRWPELPRDTFYATGHDGQKVIVIPSQDLVVVRMGFTPEADAEPSQVRLAADLIAATR